MSNQKKTKKQKSIVAEWEAHCKEIDKLEAQYQVLHDQHTREHVKVQQQRYEQMINDAFKNNGIANPTPRMVRGICQLALSTGWFNDSEIVHAIQMMCNSKDPKYVDIYSLSELKDKIT